MAAQPTSPTRPLGIDSDTETILATARRRWWVLPIIAVLVLLILLVQKPEPAIQPSYFRLDRTYQVITNSAPVELLGLSGNLLRPLPDLDTLLAQITSSDSYSALQADKPGLRLDVKRLAPELALNVDETAEGIVTLRGRGEPVIGVVCTEPTDTACRSTLDELKNLIEVTFQAALQNQLEALINTTDSLASLTSSEEVLASRLTSLRFAIKALEKQELGNLALIREFNAEAPETAEPSTLNLRFGIAITAILSFLIILQWSIIDKRIYGLRRIMRTVGEHAVIGGVKDTSDVEGIVAAAAALRRIADDSSSIRVFRLGEVDTSTLTSIASRSEVPLVESAFGNLTTRELGDVNTKNVVVVQRGSGDAEKLLRLSTALKMSSGTNPHILMLG